MSVPVENYTWGQGEDLVLSLIYRSGPVQTEADTTDPNEVGKPPRVDLTGYSLRMDVVNGTGVHVYTFNSDDTAPLDQTGPEDNEATLGTDGSINITVPRALALPGGPVYDSVQANENVFHYDIFLRDSKNKQKKILRGTITVEKSYTLWS